MLFSKSRTSSEFRHELSSTISCASFLPGNRSAAEVLKATAEHPVRFSTVRGSQMGAGLTSPCPPPPLRRRRAAPSPGSGLQRWTDHGGASAGRLPETGHPGASTRTGRTGGRTWAEETSSRSSAWSHVFRRTDLDDGAVWGTRNQTINLLVCTTTACALHQSYPDSVSVFGKVIYYNAELLPPKSN